MHVSFNFSTLQENLPDFTVKDVSGMKEDLDIQGNEYTYMQSKLTSGQ